MELPPGTIVDGRFQVFRAYAVGGFGAIYEAKQVNLDRFVALKLLREDVMLDQPSLARFEREAKAMSSIKNRNVCQCYAYGVWHNMPYMALEFIQGENLQTIIHHQGRLHTKRALELVMQICEGLSSAHKHGLVHRDLKPTNIIIARVEDEEIAKIIDFGLAKVLPGYGMTVQRLTETGITMGSVNYMSPEQCTGQQIDARADVYSAGCILFECLTGEKLFEGDDPVTVMMRHLHDHVPSIKKYRLDDFDANSIDAVVTRATEKDPAARYQSADEMVADIQRILTAQVVETGWRKRSKINYPGMKQPRRFKWLIGVVSAVLCVAIAGGGYVWWQHHLRQSLASGSGGNNVYDASHEVDSAIDALESGVFDDASRIARAVLARERQGQKLLPRQSSELHAVLGMCYAQRELFDRSYAETRAALDKTDTLSHTLSRLLIRQFEKARSPESKLLLFAGAQKHPCPTDPDTAMQLYCVVAEIYETAHNTKDARHWLIIAGQQPSKKARMLGWYWGSLARCDAFENKRDDAIAHYFKSLSISNAEDEPWAVGELLHFLCDWKQFEKAQKVFDIVKSEPRVEQASRTAELHAMQAEVYAAQHKTDKAANEMTAVLRMTKNEPDLINRYLVWQPLQASTEYFGLEHKEQKYVTLDREAFAITAEPANILRVGEVLDRLDNEPQCYRDFDGAIAARNRGDRATARALFEKVVKDHAPQMDATRLADSMIEVAQCQRDDGDVRGAAVSVRNAILVREQQSPKQDWPGRTEYFALFKELVKLARKN